jgi:hypothetical protein
MLSNTSWKDRFTNLKADVYTGGSYSNRTWTVGWQLDWTGSEWVSVGVLVETAINIWVPSTTVNFLTACVQGQSWVLWWQLPKTGDWMDSMGSEVLPVVKMSMSVFWVVTLCGLVSRYQRFGGTYCLHFQPWRLTEWVLTPYGLVGRYQRSGGTYCLHLQGWSEWIDC